MCLRLYLTCRGQGRSSSHGTVCTTVLLTKHCFGNNWTYTFCKAFSSAEKIWPDDFFFFLAIFPAFSLCRAHVNAELNTRLNFHSGWKWCSANAMYESEAVSQINGNEMFHFSSSPKSDSLLDGVSAEETCFLLSVIIKSNQSSSTWKSQFPEPSGSKYQPGLAHRAFYFSWSSLVMLVFLRGGYKMDMLFT